MRSFTWRSRTLLTIGRTDIGQQPPTDELGRSVFGMGTILPVFHSLGSVPVDRDILKSLVRLGAIL